AVTCWLLDTRSLWAGDNIREAAADLLPLLSPDELASVTRKHFIKDARMSLGSALLKRAYISRELSMPWNTIRFERRPDPVHGKPTLVAPSSSFPSANNNNNNSTPPISFNVSHQAGLVALMGTTAAATDLGVDIVCVNERNDYRVIDADGFDAWVDIYADCFSDAEMWDMKFSLADGITLLDGTHLSAWDLGRHDRCVRRNLDLSATQTIGENGEPLPAAKQRAVTFSSDLVVDAKLRRFYAFWALKEAYVKLTGEALLAPWLRELEFRNVRAPRPGTVARCSTHGAWGERVADVDVWFKGARVDDVRMEIQAYEEDYMVALAVR
ncbi:uncharacterized protein BKA78DRAFT_243378, partial [Phyllosticta capitalensis]